MRYGRAHRFAVDGTILCVTSYYILAKATELSFSAFLRSVLQPSISGPVLKIAYCLIGYAVVAKLVLYAVDHFRKDEHFTLQSPHQRCLLKCNTEIDRHLRELFAGKFSLASMAQKHTSEENLQVLHQGMAEHFREVLKLKKLIPENLFISIFHDPTFSPDVEHIAKLEYVSHYDPTVHDTATLEIDINGEATKGFAGVRAFKTNKTVLCSAFGKGQYVTGACERRKSVAHFIGIPLRVMGHPVAILNIEFHGKQYFHSARELKEFFRKEVQAFVYMYEYQVHKKYFFHHLKERVVA
jgi:hypothetical protein